MQELECDESSYLNYVKKYISELNITNKYKNALTKCVDKLFDPIQLPKNNQIDEINRKIIAAERDLVNTRFHANEYDVLFAYPHLIEDDILHQYSSYINRTYSLEVQNQAH